MGRGGLKMITRVLEQQLQDAVKLGRVAIVYGPRRAGKTTLLENYLKTFQGRAQVETGDDRLVRALFEANDRASLLQAFQGVELLVLDEAQLVPQLGMGLKMLVDARPDLKIIASGSSSFEIAREVGEPLTGRKRTLTLLPISVEELIHNRGLLETKRSLNELMTFGLYPEILTAPSQTEKRRLIHELTEDYLFKDIIAFEGLRNSDKIRRLLTLLAYQIGKEVSLTELGTQLGMSKQVVERFLDLLEKTFIIQRVTGFSRNLRSEVSKSSRYYFVDNGVLCAVQNNHAPLSSRGDVGALWENFLFMERVKFNLYHETFKRIYFWRTYSQQEIDFVEEGDGSLAGFEFKWSNRSPKAPLAWRTAYPDATFSVITPDNFETFVS